MKTLVSKYFIILIRGMNRFTILKQLGRGTFGIVYRAYDNLCKRDVAIKQIAKSGDCINREIEILGTVKNNEFCVQILDIFYSSYLVFL